MGVKAAGTCVNDGGIKNHKGQARFKNNSDKITLGFKKLKNIMRLIKPAFFFILVLLVPNKLLADPSPAKKITHPESECIVEASAGEYPFYKVKRNEKIIYSPTSDGIIKAIFSPSGKQIAFSGSEISPVDIEKGKYEYAVVILECSTGKLIGFEEGFPYPDLTWVTEQKLRFTDAASEKEVIIDLALIK